MLRAAALFVATLAMVVLPSLGAQTRAQDLQVPYISPLRAVPKGKAPGMHFKIVKNTPEEKVYALIFSPGDEVISGLTDFALQNHIGDAHFTAIGGFSEATLAWYDGDKKMFKALPVDQTVEVLSMIGDIALADGKPVVHTHITVGKEDGTTTGGHCFEAFVRPTLEVFVTANMPRLEKVDAPTGIKVIDPVR